MRPPMGFSLTTRGDPLVDASIFNENSFFETVMAIRLPETVFSRAPTPQLSTSLASGRGLIPTTDVHISLPATATVAAGLTSRIAAPGKAELQADLQRRIAFAGLYAETVRTPTTGGWTEVPWLVAHITAPESSRKFYQSLMEMSSGAGDTRWSQAFSVGTKSPYYAAFTNTRAEILRTAHQFASDLLGIEVPVTSPGIMSPSAVKIWNISNQVVAHEPYGLVASQASPSCSYTYHCGAAPCEGPVIQYEGLEAGVSILRGRSGTEEYGGAWTAARPFAAAGASGKVNGLALSVPLGMTAREMRTLETSFGRDAAWGADSLRPVFVLKGKL